MKYARRQNISLRENVQTDCSSVPGGYVETSIPHWTARYSGYLYAKTGRDAYEEQEYLEMSRSGKTAERALNNLEEAFKENDWEIV